MYLFEGQWKAGALCVAFTAGQMMLSSLPDCLEVFRERRGGGTPRPSLGYNHVIGKLSALLPLVRTHLEVAGNVATLILVLLVSLCWVLPAED